MGRRYVTGLIPGNKKIFKDVFQGTSERNQPKKLHWWKILLSGLIVLCAFGFSNNFISGLILASISLLFVPAVESVLENMLQVKLVRRVKLCLSGLVILFSIPVSIASHHIQLAEQKEKAMQVLAEKQRLALEERNEKARKDSLMYYLKLLATPSRDIEQSLKLIDRANAFVKFSNEIDQLSNKKTTLLSNQIDLSIKKGDYKTALKQLDNIIAHNNKEPDHFYRRAVCYQKLRQPQAAVNDLHKAIELGSTAAQKLYEVINPLRRRVSYYVTRCCDGTTSNAKGRGACSWHGGVCNWNEPVYEEYRQYE